MTRLALLLALALVSVGGAALAVAAQAAEHATAPATPDGAEESEHEVATVDAPEVAEGLGASEPLAEDRAVVQGPSSPPQTRPPRR